MQLISATEIQKNKNIFSAIASSTTTTLFLFYIDEGYYSFKWMLQWGNWIAFCMYFVLLLPFQYLIARFIFKNFSFKMKTLFSCLIGVITVLSLIIKLF